MTGSRTPAAWSSLAGASAVPGGRLCRDGARRLEVGMEAALESGERAALEILPA
ncbi:MAG: hypothetical protein JNM50_02130 [Chromatiales bacterium]|nr:hypothetical protein [Chromatiales bacterium]